MRCHLLECFAREKYDAWCAESHLYIRVCSVPFRLESEDIAIESHHLGIVGGKEANGIERETRFRLRHHLSKLHEPHLVEQTIHLYLLRIVVFEQGEYLACKLKAGTAICRNDILVAHCLCVDIAGGVGISISTPQLKLLNAIARVADIVEESLARHPWGGIADGTDYATFADSIDNERCNTFCRLAFPSISSNEHQCCIVVGNRIKRIVGQQAETADSLNRLHRLSHNLVLILRILLHCHAIRTQRLRKIRQLMLSKLRQQNI